MNAAAAVTPCNVGLEHAQRAATRDATHCPFCDAEKGEWCHMPGRAREGYLHVARVKRHARLVLDAACMCGGHLWFVHPTMSRCKLVDERCGRPWAEHVDSTEIGRRTITCPDHANTAAKAATKETTT